jgi:hypothetical protein
MRRLLMKVLDDQRIVVGLGLLVAVAAGAFVIVGLPKNAGYPAANAAAQVLLDTKDSQLVTAASQEAINLPMRASLLGDLLATEQGTSLLARDAHIAPNELTVVPPTGLDPPAFQSPLEVKAAPFSAAATTPYVVLLSSNLLTAAQDDPTPVILIQTQAPNLAGATTLVDAATSAMNSILAAQASAHGSPFVVRTVTAAHMVVIPRRSRRPVYAVIGGLVIFLLWYGAAALASGVARRMQRPQLA